MILDKACFQHGIPYAYSKDLPRRTASDKLLQDKAFKIAKSLEYDGYQRGLISIVYKFFKIVFKFYKVSYSHRNRN